MRNIDCALGHIEKYIPKYIPEVGKTVVFHLGYGRLKLWRVTERLVWCGFILPYKQNPTLDNLLHITPDELIMLCKANNQNNIAS